MSSGQRTTKARLAPPPTAGEIGIVDFDPLTIDADPYPIYRRLRNEAPVLNVTCAAGSVYLLSRFNDVQAAARDWRSFSCAWGNDPDDTEDLFQPGIIMGSADPPVHTRLRNALRREFLPSAVHRLEAGVRLKVRQMIDSLRGSGRVDVVSTLAERLPVDTVYSWLGVPRADHPELARLRRTMFERVPGRADLPDAAVTAGRDVRAYLADALEQRRGRHGDDLLSAIAGAEWDRQLSRDEAVTMAALVFDAGVSSTTAVIGSSFWRLSQFVDQWEQLRRARELVPGAVEEFLRFDSPFHCFKRVTTRPMTLHGSEIPADSVVLLMLAAANRDGRRWEEADELQLARRPQRHLSFSDGVHACLGAPVARMELRILFEELLPRLRGFAVAGEITRRTTPTEWTIASLPIDCDWM